MYMQLEDEFGDVVGKARRGQERTLEEVADACGLSTDDLVRIEGYELVPPESELARLAEHLGLDAGKLRASAAKGFFPLYPAGRPAGGLVVEMMILGTDFLMNGYVVGCSETSRGVIIDPGFEAEKILKTVESSGLEIDAVLLTHGHGDHIGALSEVCQATGAPAYINSGDMQLIGGGRSKIEGEISAGDTIPVGNQELEARMTAGHTPGGITFVHKHVAFVGDALFAGSLGGTRNLAAYEGQRQAVKREILELEERLVLYPGHGPATTVGEERTNNPYFSTV